MADQFFNLLRHVDLGHFYFVSRRNKTRDQRIFSSLIRSKRILVVVPSFRVVWQVRIGSSSRKSEFLKKDLSLQSLGQIKTQCEQYSASVETEYLVYE